MTFEELRKLQFDYSQSARISDKIRAEAYLDIIKEFNRSKIKEYSEEVKISRIATEYKERNSRNFQLTGKQEYKLKSLAGNTLVIQYLTQAELSKILEANNVKSGASLNYILDILRVAGVLWKTPASLIDFSIDLMTI